MNPPTNIVEFPRLDPASPAFWDVRFEAGFMPWDHGGVPHCLAEYVAREPAPQRVLIPGCGSAHEAKFFLANNWRVDAIDFSAAAVLRAKKVLGPLGATVREADFFGDALATEHFDVIYERAFLCALPVRLRQDWAARVASLLRSGGKLIGFFYFDQSERGPPFGIEAGTLSMMLSTQFELIQELTPTDSIPVFAGKERWQVWQRR